MKSAREILAENLQQLIFAKRIDQRVLAERLGVSDAAVSQWISGDKYPRIDKIQKIADFFNVPKSRITEEYVPDSRFRVGTTFAATPLIGTICAGNGMLAEQNIEEYIHYPFPCKRQPDYALRVKGDSMIGADIRDGDIVYMREATWADYNGQIVAVLVNDNEDGTLKRIRWTEGSPKIRLEPENDTYKTLELFPNEISICGIYMGHFRPDQEGR